MRVPEITATLLISAMTVGFAHAQAQTGWCFPGDGCTGEVPITDNGFFTCEENCVMTNPVSIRGMNATLYDVQCTGDTASYEMRMLFKEYVDAAGRDRMLALSSRGPHLEDEGAVELHKCL